MEHVLVRYSEIGTKSPGVRHRMLSRLADRVAERLEYEEIDHQGVERIGGRICFATPTPTEAANAVSELPGVQSTSPAIKTVATLPAIKEATDFFSVGATFGVDTNRSGSHSFTSQAVNEEVGAYIEDRTGARVDLMDPDTWVEIDIRDDTAYVFTTRYDGSGGFPVGSQTPVAALISGGIDSPVAAYEMMTRGCDITPIYFYNKPIAAGDHVLRFESALSKLVRFHPEKDWSYYCVDMEPINTTLLEKCERGRMLLHRGAMFQIASKLAEQDGLHGIVTGESLGQKSSQTGANLFATTHRSPMPVFRPLLTRSKEQIVEQARKLGTFEDATIDSACRSLAPDRPATMMAVEQLETLENEINLADLIATTLATVEKTPLVQSEPIVH